MPPRSHSEGEKAKDQQANRQQKAENHNPFVISKPLQRTLGRSGDRRLGILSCTFHWSECEHNSCQGTKKSAGGPTRLTSPPARDASFARNRSFARFTFSSTILKARRRSAAEPQLNGTVASGASLPGHHFNAKTLRRKDQVKLLTIELIGLRAIPNLFCLCVLAASRLCVTTMVQPLETVSPGLQKIGRFLFMTPAFVLRWDDAIGICSRPIPERERAN